MTSSVLFMEVAKSFGSVEALKPLDLRIDQGEFVVLVGPSGSGKTTTLRLLAGLEQVSQGKVWISERLVNDVPAAESDVAMVLQTYALYPHMTVRRNLEYGLKRRRLDRAIITRISGKPSGCCGSKSSWTATRSNYRGGSRPRRSMSGAVRDLAVLLMDEPLSSLDAQLRTHARSEIKRLQAETGTTTVYVTHDQVEAMTMGDRIAVMSHAELVQCGTPEEVYRRPATTFVAGFIGSPAMNLIQTDIASAEGVWRVRIGDQVATLGTPRNALADAVRSLEAVQTIGIRPEDLRIRHSEQDGWSAPIRGKIIFVEDLGHVRFVHVEVAKA